MKICKHCEGSCVIVIQNGADDYDLEVCQHCKIYERIQEYKKEQNKGQDQRQTIPQFYPA